VELDVLWPGDSDCSATTSNARPMTRLQRNGDGGLVMERDSTRHTHGRGNIARLQRGHNARIKPRKEHQEVPSLAYRQSGRVHRSCLAKLPSGQWPHTAYYGFAIVDVPFHAHGWRARCELVVRAVRDGVCRVRSQLWSQLAAVAEGQHEQRHATATCKTRRECSTVANHQPGGELVSNDLHHCIKTRDADNHVQNERAGYNWVRV
jgi:hypothetical protein